MSLNAHIHTKDDGLSARLQRVEKPPEVMEDDDHPVVYWLYIEDDRGNEIAYCLGPPNDARRKMVAFNKDMDEAKRELIQEITEEGA